MRHRQLTAKCVGWFQGLEQRFALAHPAKVVSRMIKRLLPRRSRETPDSLRHKLTFGRPCPTVFTPSTRCIHRDDPRPHDGSTPMG